MSSPARVFLVALFLTAQLAFAGRFDLPKDDPQISIHLPDNWRAGLERDGVSAHPAENSKVMLWVFPLTGANNLKDAFAMATKQLSASHSDVKIGNLGEQKQAGITFFGGQGEGEKDGFELILAVAGFSADGKHFFGLAWTRDDASGDGYIADINKALASIQPFKATPKPQSSDTLHE